jgi:hypothetical protein
MRPVIQGSHELVRSKLVRTAVGQPGLQQRLLAQTAREEVINLTVKHSGGDCNAPDATETAQEGPGGGRDGDIGLWEGCLQGRQCGG